MSFWIAASLLTAGTLIWLMRTYARAGEDQSLSAADVYDAQLRELEREAADGLLPEAELESARTEITRRQSRACTGSEVPSSQGPSRLVAAIIGGVMVVGTLLLYLYLGQPGLPAQPFALRDPMEEAEARMTPIAEEIEADLASIPDPADRAIYLAEVFKSLGAWEDAVGSYKNALSHRANDIEAITGIGEVIVLANEGQVTPEALTWIDRALDLAPDNPRAVFYRAVYDHQQLNHDEAVARLDALLGTAPEDAPWRARVEELRAAIVAMQNANSAADDILALPDTERDAAIRSMVDGLAARLEADPEDFEGWLLLANARAVLGERDAAAAALDAATRLAEGEPSLLARIDGIRTQHGLEN